MAALLAGPLMVAGAAGVAGSEPPPPPAVAVATGANWGRGCPGSAATVRVAPFFAGGRGRAAPPAAS